MPTGAITNEIDVAQLVLYAFWIFFIGLIIYLRREDRREGYPLEADATERGWSAKPNAFPSPASPKVFNLESGEKIVIPSVKPEAREIAAKPADRYPGAPLVPTGDPMLDAVGPASYALRADEPDHTFEGEPRIVPLRVATDFSVDSRDPDPVGMQVVGADGEVAGTVADVWIDRAEFIARYFEVEVGTAATAATETVSSEAASAETAPADGAEAEAAPVESAAPVEAAPAAAHRVLLPVPFLSQINAKLGQIRVESIMAHHFAGVPTLRNPDQVTLLEEDRICAYYGGGHLYAHPSRQEPLL